MEDDDDYDGEGEDAKACKVVLLGEAGVGKTSIISRFIHNKFEENLETTTGASYAGKNMIFKDYQNQVVKFEIWDTAGQEKYRSLAKVFYKNSSACILVYDITRRNSFEELKNFWINEIKVNGSPNLSN